MAFPFKPFSQRQLDVVTADLARLNILEGSVRSGKTIASAVRWVNYVGLETSPGAQLLMLGVTIDTLKRNVINDILDIVGPQFADYRDNILYLFGRTIYCIGANDVKAEKRIRGMTVEGAYIDEATQIPQVVIEQAILRCSAGRGRIIFTTNPDSPFHWFYKDYVSNEKGQEEGRIKVWHFELDDNLALSEEYKEDVRRSFKGLWYKRMVKGLWVMAEGVIYDFFDVTDHGYSHQPGFDYFDLTIDYGTQNPFAALLIGARGELSWAEKEYYYSGRESQKQKTDGQYSKDLKTWLKGVTPRRIFIDPSATSMIAQLKKDGFRNIITANNEVLPGIQTVSNRLCEGKLHVNAKGCPNLIKEFGVYSWDPKAAERGDDKPSKKNDHCLDALRYREHTLYSKHRSSIVTQAELARAAS